MNWWYLYPIVSLILMVISGIYDKNNADTNLLEYAMCSILWGPMLVIAAFFTIIYLIFELPFKFGQYIGGKYGHGKRKENT